MDSEPVGTGQGPIPRDRNGYYLMQGYYLLLFDVLLFMLGPRAIWCDSWGLCCFINILLCCTSFRNVGILGIWVQVSDASRAFPKFVGNGRLEMVIIYIKKYKNKILKKLVICH